MAEYKNNKFVTFMDSNGTIISLPKGSYFLTIRQWENNSVYAVCLLSSETTWDIDFATYSILLEGDL